jgi:hypothetical protein
VQESEEVTTDDLWNRLGWRRATALSIHFFSTLHPTTIPCLAYDEDGWTIYMFAIENGQPVAWPEKTEVGPVGPIGCPRLAMVFLRSQNQEETQWHQTDWPNACSASLMVRSGVQLMDRIRATSPSP